jgi:hypothetical protein
MPFWHRRCLGTQQLGVDSCAVLVSTRCRSVWNCVNKAAWGGEPAGQVWERLDLSGNARSKQHGAESAVLGPSSLEAQALSALICLAMREQSSLGWTCVQPLLDQA